MTDALFDQLSRIHAYDTGDRGSGLHDKPLRARLVAEFDALSDDELRLRLSRWVRGAYLSDDAIAQGYGWEDALKFLRWIDEGDFRA